MTASQSLGLAADSPGSLVLADNELRVSQRSPHSYDVLDIRVQAPAEAELIIDLTPVDAPRSTRQLKFALANVVAMKSSYRADLDDRKNRLLVHRVPGDDLRVAFDRDSLVFAPLEQFTFTVTPHQSALVASTSYRCSLQLLAAGGKEVWREERDFTTDADGQASVLAPITVPIPEDEGVYEIVVAVAQRRIAVPLLPKSQIAFRKIQFVVIGSNPTQPSEDIWHTELEIDLANPRWLDRLKRFQPKLMSGMGQEPLSNKRSHPLDHLGEKQTQLDPGGWVAIPLQVSRTDELHRMELSYPSDLRQTLSISIIEPDAAGRVTNVAVDSGIDVPDSTVATPGKMETHRIAFWPRTKTPYLLLLNRRGDAAAVFGKIRIQTGPKTLPPTAVQNVDSGRSFALLLDKPLFPENFNAGEVLDTPGQTLEDWSTFYLGATRLIQYAKSVGYDSIVLSVYHEGSALYPSGLLEATPTYDRGVFFQTGQDPVRKDVVELICRLCDREGLRFVPSLQFASPLPELEAILRRGGPETVGIAPVGDDGRTWSDRHGIVRGLAPYYNPLNPAVQTAIRRVVGEVVERYGHHPSFGGVALQMAPQSYMQLPDEDWGLDDQTILRFASSPLAKDVRLDLRDATADRFAKRARILRESGRTSWLSWRCQTLAQFYKEMESDIVRVRGDARLLLTNADLYLQLALTDGDVQLNRFTHSKLRPALPSRRAIADTTSRMGLDPTQFRSSSHLVLPRPTRISPVLSLWEQAVTYELARSTEMDTVYQRDDGAALHLCEGQWLNLPEFDVVSPWGQPNTRLRLLSHISPAGPHSRRWLIHSLYTADPLTIIQGGWVAPMGQEDWLRDAIAVVRALPAEKMATIPPKSKSAGSADNGTKVRQLTKGNQTYLCIIHDAPWKVHVTLELNGAAPGQYRCLGMRTTPQLNSRGTSQTITLELEPYDVWGLVFESPAISVVDWRSAPRDSVEIELAQLIHEVRTRADGLRRPDPINVLSNPSFESVMTGNGLTGWEGAKSEGVEITIDRRERQDGQQSLYMRVVGEKNLAWVRSEPLPIPATGRISVMVWLKTRDLEHQPPLRLAVEGRVDERPYFRFARLGRLEKDPPADAKADKVTPLNAVWGKDPYLFHVDDLPPSGLTDLRVVFELAGEGEVWIDNVAIYDKWFQTHERDELVKLIGAANLNLSDGRLSQCERFLDSYWPRFLMEHVTPPPPARLAERTNRTPATTPQTVPTAPATKQEGTSSWMKKFNPFQKPK